MSRHRALSSLRRHIHWIDAGHDDFRQLGSEPSQVLDGGFACAVVAEQQIHSIQQDIMKVIANYALDGIARL
jgi:hypothetical protein